MVEVVGTMFFKNKKLLIDKPRKRNTYQMVGGRVENDEVPLEAAIRECYEELGGNVILEKDLFSKVMEFDEIATSDPNLKIHFYVFKYDGYLNEDFVISEEIESFLWYSSDMGEKILSNTLKNEVVPYCVKNKLIK